MWHIEKYDNIILSILSKLGLECSVFFSTFHSSNLTSSNWRMHVLAEVMNSLTQEQENLVEMGTIKSAKDKSLVGGVSNQYKGNNKFKD